MRMTRIAGLGAALFLVAATGAAAGVDLPVKQGDGYTSPKQVEGATTITVERAHELWQKRVAFIDPRKDSDWQAGRIPGARHIVYNPGKPDQELTEAALKEVLAKDEPVVFYCNGTNCDRSSWSAALAAEWGWDEVYYLRKGYPAWEKAGYPTR
jgi:rhodanese-related sulfurtransferase